MASRSKEVNCHQDKKDMDLLEQLQRTREIIRRLGHLSYEGRLREQGLLSLERKRI